LRTEYEKIKTERKQLREVSLLTPSSILFIHTVAEMLGDRGPDRRATAGKCDPEGELWEIPGDLVSAAALK
jgi:hypothetical protein